MKIRIHIESRYSNAATVAVVLGKFVFIQRVLPTYHVSTETINGQNMTTMIR